MEKELYFGRNLISKFGNFYGFLRDFLEFHLCKREGFKKGFNVVINPATTRHIRDKQLGVMHAHLTPTMWHKHGD